MDDNPGRPRRRSGGGGQIPLLSNENPEWDRPNTQPSLHDQEESQDDPTTTVPGYTTHDDLGPGGDDTFHAPVRFYDVPNCIGSRVFFPNTSTTGTTGTLPPQQQQAASSPEKVDLIYNAFIEPWILSALEFLGQGGYGEGDTEVAIGGQTMTGVIRGWVGGTWGCGGVEDEDA